MSGTLRWHAAEFISVITILPSLSRCACIAFSLHF